MTKNVRFALFVIFSLVTLVPGYMAYREVFSMYRLVQEMRVQFTPGLYQAVYAHALIALFWMILAMVLLEIGNFLGTTPEERKRLKEAARERRLSKLKRYRPQPLR